MKLTYDLNPSFFRISYAHGLVSKVSNVSMPCSDTISIHHWYFDMILELLLLAWKLMMMMQAILDTQAGLLYSGGHYYYIWWLSHYLTIPPPRIMRKGDPFNFNFNSIISSIWYCKALESCGRLASILYLNAF